MIFLSSCNKLIPSCTYFVFIFVPFQCSCIQSLGPGLDPTIHDWPE
jgi:hypothetical protein